MLDFLLESQVIELHWALLFVSESDKSEPVMFSLRLALMALSYVIGFPMQPEQGLAGGTPREWGMLLDSWPVF
mgnify:CR=1 FL=1